MKKRILKCVLCVLLCAVICLSSVVAVSAVRAFDSPFVKYDNIVITYSTAEFVPSAYPIITFDGLLVLSEASGVDPFTLLQAYSFYKCSQGNYICAELKSSSTPFGYVFWRDSNGDYQYFIWKEGEEEESFSPVSDEIINSEYAPVTVTVKELREFLDSFALHFFPTNTSKITSWRTRVYDVTDTYSRVPLYSNGFFGIDNLQEAYLVPFYTDGFQTYISAFQMHFYFENSVDDNGNAVKSLYVSYWDMIEECDPVSVLISDKMMDYNYFEISAFPSNYDYTFYFYDSFSDYFNRKATESKNIYLKLDCGTKCSDYWTLDLSKVLSLSYMSNGSLWKSFINNTTTSHDSSCSTCFGLHDIGFYCNSDPITMNFSDIDFTQFSDDDTVTLTGDTVYDYTITNNEGDSTTINNYITNNYTYPATDTGDSGEEGSGTGGTGDINVNVDVDVNNTMGGFGNTSAYEYEQANVAEALEQIPEVSDGFIGFFTKVFDWLPPPIFGLILGGLGLAIVLRIAGR